MSQTLPIAADPCQPFSRQVSVPRCGRSATLFYSRCPRLTGGAARSQMAKAAVRTTMVGSALKETSSADRLSKSAAPAPTPSCLRVRRWSRWRWPLRVWRRDRRSYCSDSTRSPRCLVAVEHSEREPLDPVEAAQPRQALARRQCRPTPLVSSKCAEASISRNIAPASPQL